MGLGLVMVGGLCLVAYGLDWWRKGQRIVGLSAAILGVVITALAVAAIRAWSPMFD